MELTNRIWILMARSLSGEISIEEKEELLELLGKNAELQQQYELMLRLWRHEKTATAMDEHATEEDREHVARILQIAKKKQAELQVEQEQLKILNENIDDEKDFTRVRRRRRIRHYAVPILIIATLFSSIYFWPKDTATNAAKPSIPNQITAQKGSRTRSILPDGSTVWVNAGSSISYEGDFTGKLREVKLEGEAYFDVVKNPNKPFIVHTGGIKIKVLGTSFNVKSYASDKTVETTLIRGLVQVTRESDPGQKPIFLHPNEKLTLEKVAANSDNSLSDINPDTQKKPEPTFAITRLDTTIAVTDQIETAWLYNRLAFRGDSFETLALKLERWYNINIIFEDEKVKHLNFNGSFENETVEQAFEALKAAVPFNFKIHTHDVSVSSAK